MTSENVNPSVKSDSKYAKKSPAKPTITEASQLSTNPEPSHSIASAPITNRDGNNENLYIRELQKSIRNVNKKITNASKVDNVIAENPDQTLDQLVASRKINADQKAQVLKKPALQASLSQLEEQAHQYNILDADFKARLQNEKANIERTTKEQADKDLEDAVAQAKHEAADAARKHLEESLLLLSQFLKLAAIRRAEEEAAELEESKALEGLLAQVYSGDSSAVAAMLNLIDGSEITLKSVNGEDLSVTYASLKVASKAQVPYIEIEDPAIESESATDVEKQILTDSTTLDTNITGIHETANNNLTNGHIVAHHEPETPSIIEINHNNVNVATEAVPPASRNISETQDQVKTPVNSGNETKAVSNGNTDFTSNQSWADDQPETVSEKPSVPAPASGDGFQEIQRNRGRGNRSRYNDGYRGRGNHRGDGYRGRGRGGGGNRGARRSEN